MTSQEDRERFAPLFGFKDLRVTNETCGLTLTSRSPLSDYNGGMRQIVPDFCNIKGQYFGPACKELGQSGWVMLYDPINKRWSWESRVDHELTQTDHDLGRCTMLALEKQRAMEGKNEPS